MISFLKKLIISQLLIMIAVMHYGICSQENERLFFPFSGQRSNAESDDLLDRMERGEISEQVVNLSSNNLERSNKASIPAAVGLFFTSFVEPLTTGASQTYNCLKTQVHSLKTQVAGAENGVLLDKLESGKGVENFTISMMQKGHLVATQLTIAGKDKVIAVGRVLKDNPAEAVSVGLGMTIGWTDVAQVAPTVTTAVVTAVNSVRQTKLLYSLAQSIEGEKWVSKTLRFGLYAGAVCVLAAAPAAAALEWNSLADAKAHYSNPISCYDDPDYGSDWLKVMDPVTKCLKDGGSLETCQTQIPGLHGAYAVGRDLYAFTRHESANPDLNPVSIVQLNNQQTCFLTALNTESPVTKTCFPSLTNLDVRTVEVVPGLTLMRAHEGLAAGQSVRHAGLHLGGHASCGYFGEAPAKYTLGDKPACLLTALTPGGEVTQMCFDPQNPETLTVKPVEGISLDFKDNGGQPVSIIIKDPSKFGLDTKPVISKNSNPPLESSLKEGDRVCEGNKCYRLEKVEIPCEEKNEL